MNKKLTKEQEVKLASMKAKGCKHEEGWEFICDGCDGNFCGACFGMNACKSCEADEI